MHKIKILSVVFVLIVSCNYASSIASPLAFSKLLVNSKENPTAIESEQPLFSWVVDAKGINKSQSAYHIMVASSLEGINSDNADIWNSSKVESSKSAYVAFEGKSLKALGKYYWKVKIWDESGNASDWSEAQVFQMGLMGQESWGASQWITLGKDTRTSPHRFRDYKTGKMKQAVPVDGFAASYFRKEVSVAKKVKNAQVYVCGLGYYELFLNGNKVGDHVLDPAPSNYDKQAYYVNYDITDQLESGKNAFGIVLGNGFYGQNISWKNDPESERDLAYGPPTVKSLIKVTYTDGTQEDFYTDQTWKESTGPIVFNNIYGGDTYDARYEINGWNRVGYNDSSWANAALANPKIKKISAQQIPAIKRLKVLEPQRVFKGADGEWIVDFGQNIAGWIHLTVSEKRGQLIDIITTEALLTNGKDIYLGSTGGGAIPIDLFSKQNLYLLNKILESF